MTQEEKQLLLKDLCARLPYGVEIICEASTTSLTLSAHMLGEIIKDGNELQWKPYLRPMSSMTEEERKEAVKLGVCYDGAFHNDIYDVGTGMDEAFLAISWLLERHFDINYLIEKGLALKAPEGMYEVQD